MFTIIEELGPASWLDPDWHKTELTAANYLLQSQLNDPSGKSMAELLSLLEWLRENGRRMFKKRNFSYAYHMFRQAFDVTQQLPCYPKREISLCLSNQALCYLKLEEPFQALRASIEALSNDPNNVKASYCLISSKYMMYNFDEALNIITSVLAVHPELKELKILREKIQKNTIPQKFSSEIIQQRISKYIMEESHNFSWLLQVEPMSTLIELVQENNSAAMELADRKIAIMKCHVKDIMVVKNHLVANQICIDMLYIIDMLENKFKKKVEEEIIFEVLSNRAICLYFMEMFGEAMKCCQKARQYKSDAVDVLISEAKILCKLDKLDEALKTIDRCIRVVNPNSVEAVICEEILFEINFKKDTQNHPANKHSEDSKVTSDHSAGKEKVMQDKTKFQKVASKEKTNQMKETASSVPVMMVEQTSEQDEYLMMTCKLCGVVVSTPWNEHIATDEHQNLSEVVLRFGHLSSD